MKIHPATKTILLLAVLLVTTSHPCKADHGLLFETVDKTIITMETLLKDVQGAQVIFFGEAHGRKQDHIAQNEFIRKLHELDPNIVIAMEAIGFESQEVVDAFLDGQLREEKFKNEFAKNSAPALYGFYKPTFDFAVEERIPILALRPDHEVLIKILINKPETLSTEDLARLPGYDPECKIDLEYEAYLKLLADIPVPFVEDKNFRPGFDNLCRFFMAMDSVMSHNLAQHLEKHPKNTIIAITGSAHAWKFGIPAQLKKFGHHNSRSILPTWERDFFTNYQVFEDEADYVWWHIE